MGQDEAFAVKSFTGSVAADLPFPLGCKEIFSNGMVHQQNADDQISP